MSVIYRIVQFGNIGSMLHSVLRTSRFIFRECEVLSLLSDDASINKMKGSGVFAEKKLSHYKQKIKRKTDCHRNIYLPSALKLIKKTWIVLIG